MRPSTKFLRDRVDIVERNQRLAGQRIEGAGTQVVRRDVKCAIVPQGKAQSFIPLLGLGPMDQPFLVGVFLGDSPISTGYALRQRRAGKVAIYNVRSVTHYPNKARAEYQVAVLAEDTSGAQL